MNRTKWLFILLLAMLAIPMAVSAQTISPNDDTVIDPNANISFPPPIYTLRGQVKVFGSANLPNMNNYFLEFRPVVNRANTVNNEAWTPASLPATTPISDNILGLWDTRVVADGLYELRLTINVRGQSATYFVVSPLRIENSANRFLQENPQLVASPTPNIQTTNPTQAPVSTTPTVTATIDANVRTGDDTAYQVVGFLFNGQTATILGVSSTGTGWYYIELSDGKRGFISPNTVDVSGNTSNLTRIDPPPFPITPIPPTATPLPPSGNLAASLPDLTPDNPTCNVPFTVLINITNNGTANTTGSATVLFQDFHNGVLQSSFFRTVPPLGIGQNYVVGSDTWAVSTNGGKAHEIRVTIDPERLVSESNENDNTYSVIYTLQQGTCP